MRVPQLKQIVQNTDLRFLRVGQCLKDQMEFRDRCKTMRETLRAEIQQCLHEHIDLKRIEDGRLITDVTVVLVRIRQIL